MLEQGRRVGAVFGVDSDTDAARQRQFAAIDGKGLASGGQRAHELQRHALGEGMRTLRQDGIEKVLAGVTSIEEVRANS